MIPPAKENVCAMLNFVFMSLRMNPVTFKLVYLSLRMMLDVTFKHKGVVDHVGRNCQRRVLTQPHMP
jgi:hypothetical protein